MIQKISFIYAFFKSIAALSYTLSLFEYAVQSDYPELLQRLECHLSTIEETIKKIA